VLGANASLITWTMSVTLCMRALMLLLALPLCLALVLLLVARKRNVRVCTDLLKPID
jgi:glucose-6-phosphate-specific signal transduction histidine kinase